MRIAESTIRRIIREEARRVLQETITRDGSSDAMRHFMSKEEPAFEQPDVNRVEVLRIKNKIAMPMPRGRDYMQHIIIPFLDELNGPRELSNPDYTDFLSSIARGLDLGDYTYVDIDAAIKAKLKAKLKEVAYSDYAR